MWITESFEECHPTVYTCWNMLYMMCVCSTHKNKYYNKTIAYKQSKLYITYVELMPGVVHHQCPLIKQRKLRLHSWSGFLISRTCLVAASVALAAASRWLLMTTSLVVQEVKLRQAYDAYAGVTRCFHCCCVGVSTLTLSCRLVPLWPFKGKQCFCLQCFCFSTFLFCSTHLLAYDQG